MKHINKKRKTYILIIIVINIIGIVMINYTYKLNIEKEIEKSI